MDQHLLSWLATYGSVALFALLVLGIVGLPVPDETLLITAGVLIEQHRMLAVPTYTAALAGSVVGITVSYYIGHQAGKSALRRFGPRMHLCTDDLETARRFFRRGGKWGLMFGYFVPGIRHLTALVAGAAALEIRLFATFAYVGACIWSVTFITIGRYLGDRWHDIVGRLAGPAWPGLAGAMVAILAIVVARRWTRPPTHV